jgi:hypothetical protein
MIPSALEAWPSDTGAARFLSRRFTDSAADIDLDFGGAPRAELVTALLGLCLRTPDGQDLAEDTLWQWTVAERMQGLLAIARATTGKTTSAVAHCSHPGCAEQIELEFALDSFAGTAPALVEWQASGGEQVQCRLPTGRDQQAWHEHTLRTHGADERWLARRLLTLVDQAPPAADWTVPAAWLEPLARSLDAADPLTALTMDVSCPLCGSQLAVDVDLEALLLEGLRLRQSSVLAEIHRLARAYHWAEQEIVALPLWRRARYLARIAAEAV